MRLSFRLILFLVLGISVATFTVAGFQVRAEKRGLQADLGRRAEVLAESLQEIVEPSLERGSVYELKRIVERFGNRQRLAGVAVYGERGQTLAESSNLVARYESPLDSISRAQTEDQGFGEFRVLGGKPMHIYYLPLHRRAEVAGVLVIFHDASYIEAQSFRIWRDTLWHVIVQVLLIVSITLLIIRWRIVLPITRIAQWMREIRAGRVAPHPRLPDEDFFKPFSREVANLAQSLAEARASAEEEARLRDSRESLWTAGRLRVSLQSKLRGRPVFVVSNREPYEHVLRGKAIEVVVPASGLVTALEPVLRASEGTWIAHASGDADRETVDARDHVRVPPDHAMYTLRRVWLSKEAFEGYYFGFANEGLWPLCHIAHTRPAFRVADWEHYRNVNEKFGEVLLEEMAGTDEPIVLIQDYHFALLPRFIKEKRPDARVAIFWHIPWPNPEAFGICPWQREVLDGLLGADLVGFHIQSHCNNFLETIDRALECRIDWERFAVNRQDHLTVVRPHPISVAFPEGRAVSPEDGLQASERSSVLRSLGVESLFLAFGVDRIDYTKGILERFRAVECFLERYPIYRELFTFVQIGAPSRTSIKRYQDLILEVEREADRINTLYQTKKWKPIILFTKHHSHAEIEPFYRAADVCLVTSLHDGMNLVAKEFVVARNDEGGVLILSQFTGASRELRDALIVNPYDTEQLAEAIRFALEMNPEEKRSRMVRMRRIVKEHNIYRWAADLMSELAEIRLDKLETIREL